MEKKIKYILIGLNFLMLILSVKWYFEKGEDEPIIVIIGQFGALLVLIFEKNISNIKTKNIDNSEIKIKYTSGDNIETEKIKDSKIDIHAK